MKVSFDVEMTGEEARLDMVRAARRVALYALGLNPSLKKTPA